MTFFGLKTIPDVFIYVFGNLGRLLTFFSSSCYHHTLHKTVFIPRVITSSTKTVFIPHVITSSTKPVFIPRVFTSSTKPVLIPLVITRPTKSVFIPHVITRSTKPVLIARVITRSTKSVFIPIGYFMQKLVFYIIPWTDIFFRVWDVIPV